MARAEEESPVQIKPFAVEEGVGPGRDGHPAPDLLAKDEERNEEEGEKREEGDDVLELAPHDHRPVRVDRVVDHDPEKAAAEDGKEIGEPEEPGIAKLDRGQDRADEAADHADHGERAHESFQAGEAARLEMFALGPGQGVCSFAHFFSSSARFSSGTSPRVAFWLRCSARR